MQSILFPCSIYPNASHAQHETRSHHYYGAVVKAPLWTHAPIIITVAVCRPVRMFQMSYNKNNDDKKELSQHQQQQLGYSLTTSIVYEEEEDASHEPVHTHLWCIVW